MTTLFTALVLIGFVGLLTTAIFQITKNRQADIEKMPEVEPEMQETHSKTEVVKQVQEIVESLIPPTESPAPKKRKGRPAKKKNS